MTFTDNVEYSPFLEWNRNDPFTVDSVAHTFKSLVTMVKDNFQFDEEHVQKVSMFLSSMNRNLFRENFVDSFLNTIEQDTTNSTTVFVNSIIVLLSSSHLSIFRDTLALLPPFLNHTGLTNRLVLVSSQLIPRILSTPRLRDLSVIMDKSIMDNIISIFRNCILLPSTTNTQSISALSHTNSQYVSDIVLHEVLIPIEPSLVQITRNSLLLSFFMQYKATVYLFSNIFEISSFHQPTLDFVCSSRIPMLYQSLLTDVEDDSKHQFIFWIMSNNFVKWKTNETETAKSGKRLLETLECEGCLDLIEQRQLCHNSSPNGSCVRVYAFKITNILGTNPQRLV
ncbi:hypothetical protein BLNAU_7688 [Blattamonas nauphoetae]|uniref:FPL domain-containing protein n=1 Tax=Blattamonas nauphoetae TaxID=2049346 RepID=A0ABQ9Y0Q5_9EUKA|nr:hypothetical protein BLNAU_7688 [Blattamonas nauphoetae]